jgi:quercetin dioxygenase-like cupin family protein
VATTTKSRLVSPPPGAIRFENTTLKLWGDETSGFVNDWIYVANEKIQQLVFSIPPGGRFAHSPDYRTNLGADEIFYVVSGVLVIANPETGEVHRVESGDAVWFGPDTWHHGLSHAAETLVVVEFFAPPPSTGSSQAYANTKPYLSEPRYTRDELLGNWPNAASEVASGWTQHLIRAGDVLWRLEGQEHPILVGIDLSTDRLTTARVELLPGQRSDARVHPGDAAGYVHEGRLNICLLDESGDGRANQWFQADAQDGFYVPADTRYQLFNMTDKAVRIFLGVAPTYLANGS